MRTKLGGMRVDSGPVFMGTAAWQAGKYIFMPIFRSLPTSWTSTWLDVTNDQWAHEEGFEAFERRQSDIIAVASPSGKYMAFANAEAISKISERRKDFVKPVAVYEIINIFGTNIVTLEGEAWRRHRKVVAPAFTEKNNDLVWKESLYQMQALVRVWASRPGNTRKDMLIGDFHPDAADFSLHVISRAGFGIRLKWPGQVSDDEKDDTLSSFSSLHPPKSHNMTFKYALKTVLELLIWFAIFAPATMAWLPLNATKKASKAWLNLDLYWRELLDQKLVESRVGSTRGDGMDLMLRLVEESGMGLEQSQPEQTMADQEIMGNAFVLMLAGHETTANSIQNAFSFLAMNIDAQKHMQQDIDNIVGSKPIDQWDYKADCDRLFNSMVGAVINEQLRLIPPIMVIPKIVPKQEGDQPLTVDGRNMTIPTGTFIHLDAFGVHRNPRYWPHEPSKRTGKPNDLQDFVPERWLSPTNDSASKLDTETPKAGNTKDHTLFEPVRGAFIPFSDGQRSCIGRRFALVELTAVVASVFRDYSVELAVDEWATDEQVDRMDPAQKRTLYATAVGQAWHKMDHGCESMVTLKLSTKNTIPLRIVKRGEERFY